MVTMYFFRFLGVIVASERADAKGWAVMKGFGSYGSSADLSG